ncbi:MAG: hypothetical protein Q4G69_04730 [Planctomycetia bacterium]|nr:hypothetical protein [Planctomycetia bacterium]
MINYTEKRFALSDSDQITPDQINDLNHFTKNLLEDLDQQIDQIPEKNEKINLLIRSMDPSSLCRKEILSDLLVRIPALIEELDLSDEQDHLYHLYLKKGLKDLGWTQGSQYLEKIEDPEQKEIAFFDCCKLLLPVFTDLLPADQDDLKKRLSNIEDQDLFEELLIDFIFLSGSPSEDSFDKKAKEFEYDFEIPHFQLEYAARRAEYQKKEDSSFMQRTRDLLSAMDPSDEKDRVLPILWDLPFVRRTLGDSFLLEQWRNPEKPFQLIIQELERDSSCADLAACAEDLFANPKSGSFTDLFLLLAEIRFLIGSKDQAMDLIQKGFDFIGSIENPLGRIRIYRDLYDLLKKMKKSKTAQRIRKDLFNTAKEVQPDDLFSLVQQENIHLLFARGDFEGTDELIQEIPLLKWRIPLEAEKILFTSFDPSGSSMQEAMIKIREIDDPLERATVLEDLAERSGRIFTALAERIAPENAPNSLE